MTREEAIEFIGQSIKDNVDMAKVADAISALEQEPCIDVVSRQDAIEAVKQAIYNHDSAIMRLTELPSVTSKPKTGHWIPIYQGDEIINYRCSECELGDTNGSTNLYGWDYCRRCGAKMESEE